MRKKPFISHPMVACTEPTAPPFPMPSKPRFEACRPARDEYLTASITRATLSHIVSSTDPTEGKMTGYKMRGETPYYAMVKAALKHFEADKGVVGQGQLADHLGIKVTVSLRRALTQAELDGLVTPYRFYTERGGLAKAFEIHLEQRQMSLAEAQPDQPF